MTTLIKFIDAAYPPPSLEGCQGLCFYAGGDTPHVWTLAEVRSFNARYHLPIWVRSNPMQANPRVDAFDYIGVLKKVYHAPPGSLVALDSETSIDPAYVVPFVTDINAAGYPVIDYGSQNDVFGNQNPDGYYWGARWTGVPHIYPGDQATQYVSFPQYDLSEFQSTLPLWDTTITTPTVKEHDMVILKYTDPNKVVTTYLYNGSVVRHIVSPADEASHAAVLPVVPVSLAQLQEYMGQS